MALRVNDKLKEKFIHHPEIKRITRHRHIPKHVYNGRKEIRTSQQALKRKYVDFGQFFQLIPLASPFPFITEWAIFHLSRSIFLLFYRESNRRAHSKPGSVPYVAEKAKTIISLKE